VSNSPIIADSNELTNEIPSGFGQLTDLRHLILKQNLLTGEIPSALGTMTSLQLLLMEQNQFQGDAAPICNATLFKVGTFVADCGQETGNSTAGNLTTGKITCSCCSMCCDAGDTECNNWDWKGNLDPIWEYGYRRRRYSYDLGPVIWNP
jgi:Leucine-rich repeat (LRR) protein